MNRDDIIRHLLQAADDTKTLITDESNWPLLMRFAALVAAHEREACERLVWNTFKPDDEYVSHREAIAAAIRARGEK